jgi:VWFA-related protein
MSLAGVLAAGIALAAQQPPATTQDQPAFRAGVHVVEVDVRVFDRDGRFVTDLTRDEVTILENGVPQPLQTMFLVGAPGEAAAVLTSAAEAPATVAALPASASPRQTWVFVFDLNHLTPGGGFDRARQAVEGFIRDRFKDGDLAGVVAGSRMVNNRLTSVREELVAAARSVKPLPDVRARHIELTREWPRLLDEAEAIRIANEERDALNRAVLRACADDPSACRQVPPDLQIREKARRLQREIQRSTMETISAMNALASGLARMPGPKTVVFLSDGFVVQEVETTLRTVVGQTARAGARIYAIDVRGLNRGRGGAIVDQPQVADEAGGPAQFDLGEDGPNSLAVDTGGMMIRNENNIGRALDRIASDANVYYLLGYQPADTNFDGKFRPIEVRVTRPGVRVRARRGYLALEPSRMLIPRPVTPPASPATTPARAGVVGPVEPDPAVATAAPAGAPTRGDNATPLPAAPGTIRLRPDAGRQVEALAGGETDAAGELAKRGWEAYQRGDVEAALPAFTAAAAQPGVRPWVLYALGLSQVALGRPADAAASWERVREAAPAFEAVYLDLADTYVQLSEITRALDVLREAEGRWPKNPEFHNAIGVIHVRRGALDEAVASFTQAAAVAPEEPLAYLNLARTYEMRFVRGRRYVTSQRRWVAPEDDRQKAVENYRKYIEIGGPYAQQATEAIARLEWARK